MGKMTCVRNDLTTKIDFSPPTSLDNQTNSNIRQIVPDSEQIKGLAGLDYFLHIWDADKNKSVPGILVSIIATGKSDKYCCFL